VIPGFSSGGWVTGGVPGRDSVPAMLTPGEYVLNTSQARSFASGGGAATDNGRYFDTQNRVLMTGFSAMVAALREENAALRSEIRELRRTISAEFSRPARPGKAAVGGEAVERVATEKGLGGRPGMVMGLTVPLGSVLSGGTRCLSAKASRSNQDAASMALECVQAQTCQNREETKVAMK